jgi:hypothetical protein
VLLKLVSIDLSIVVVLVADMEADSGDDEVKDSVCITSEYPSSIDVTWWKEADSEWALVSLDVTE